MLLCWYDVFDVGGAIDLEFAWEMAVDGAIAATPERVLSMTPSIPAPPAPAALAPAGIPGAVAPSASVIASRPAA